MIHVGEFILGDDEKNAVLEVLNSGRISEGPKVREFESAFSEYVGTKYCVLVNSGTSALIAGLKALDYKYSLISRKKYKVITSPITYIADANAIILSGFEPVFADVDPTTCVITPKSIEKILSESDPSEFAGIIPIHLMGNPCDMNKINEIAKKYNLFVLEDSAQAHGSIYDGKRTGSLGDASIFSFYIAHNIQVGEMGAVTTDDPEIYKLLKKIKANGRVCDCPVCKRAEGKCPRLSKSDNYSIDPRFSHELIGYNFKTMEFQAALGLVQLKKADTIMNKRLYNVKYLNDCLSKYIDYIGLPTYDKNISYLAYTITIKRPDLISRSKFQQELESKNIETRPLFGCIPTQQPSFKKYKSEYANKIPNADNLGLNAFYIGCHQYLTNDDLDAVVSAIDDIIKNNTA